MAVNLCYPPAEDGFRNWIKKCPQVQLRTDHSGGQGWNVKPYAIMRLIDEGFDEVIWIDSDVIVMRDITRIFGQLHDDIFVATEDALGDDRDDRNALRARLWGFSVGRVLPFGLNSGVLRVTKNHYRLMARWRELLESNTYQDVQKRRWRERPAHMLGDQDVLTALLTSKEFAEIPIHILRKGKQILQFNGIYGYTVAERIGNLLGDNPAFIHSFAGKPWSEQWGVERSDGLRKYIREYVKKVYLDLSPYTLSVAQFKAELGCDTEWMGPHYVLSRFLRALGAGHPELVGLPIAALADLGRVVKSIRKATRLDRPV
ncbi:MAG TPA: hypothetical protein VN777_14375 [Terriglobales bacterium]|nr:hypothetical protein [Terriglobales bacterium]